METQFVATDDIKLEPEELEVQRCRAKEEEERQRLLTRIKTEQELLLVIKQETAERKSFFAERKSPPMTIEEKMEMDQLFADQRLCLERSRDLQVELYAMAHKARRVIVELKAKLVRRKERDQAKSVRVATKSQEQAENKKLRVEKKAMKIAFKKQEASRKQKLKFKVPCPDCGRSCWAWSLPDQPVQLADDENLKKGVA